jgi:hypothetical protein
MIPVLTTMVASGAKYNAVLARFYPVNFSKLKFVYFCVTVKTMSNFFTTNNNLFIYSVH